MHYWCADHFFPMLNSTHLVLLLPSTGPQQPHTRKPHLDFRLLLGLGRTCRQPQHQHVSARLPPVTAGEQQCPRNSDLLFWAVCVQQQASDGRALLGLILPHAGLCQQPPHGAVQHRQTEASWGLVS